MISVLAMAQLENWVSDFEFFWQIFENIYQKYFWKFQWNWTKLDFSYHITQLSITHF